VDEDAAAWISFPMSAGAPAWPDATTSAIERGHLVSSPWMMPARATATGGNAATFDLGDTLRDSHQVRWKGSSVRVTEPEHHPVVVSHREHRAADVQLRIADGITAFAGSMPFVYIHAVAFAVWMIFVEDSPWPTLTLVVSLEAIFLSAFVMIGQNRQAAFQQAKADHDFVAQELELRTNTELTRAVHVLTTEIHRRLIDEPDQQS
jgi:hypothetical protein